MQFTHGQLVVHPHHGPSTVVGLRDRTVRGVPTRYVELEVHRADLTVSVPVDQLAEVGLRDVYGREELTQLLAVLREPSDPVERQWARRIKSNRERLLLGDLLETAAVVRDLVRRDLDGKLSPAEKDMLKEARRPLLGELVESLGLSDERAEELLDAAILGGDVPTLDELKLAS